MSLVETTITFNTPEGVDKALISRIIKDVFETVHMEIEDEELALGLSGALIGTILRSAGAELTSPVTHEPKDKED